jgi:hypothetical protein
LSAAIVHAGVAKSPVRLDWQKLRPYDAAVIDKYLSGKLRW